MPRTKKTYHRDNLRQELLDAARSYVDEHGHIGLSMRTLAQRVKVSPGAPYHHFPDRRSLLLAVAAQGFTELLTKLDAALRSSLPTDKTLLSLGQAFVTFSAANPHLVDLMYESELTTPTVEPLLKSMQVSAHDAIQQLLSAKLGTLSEKEVEIRGLAFWSAVYGYASMRKKGLIQPTGSGTWKADELTTTILRRAVLAALAG